MNYISIVAHNRPQYLEEAMRGISNCRGVENYRIVVSIDPGNESAMVEAAQTWVKRIATNCSVYVNAQRFGVASHPKIAIDRLVNGLGATRVVYVEEDSVLSSDALEMVEWFFSLPKQKYQFINLGYDQHPSWTDTPWIEHPSGSDFSILDPCGAIVSPWAWAFDSEFWMKYRPYWNEKRKLPVGWDFSLIFRMCVEGWWSLRPRVSRAKNIGRLGGVHGTPEWYDDRWKNVAVSDGARAEYAVLDAPNFGERRMHPWVLQELMGD